MDSVLGEFLFELRAENTSILDERPWERGWYKGLWESSKTYQ